MSPLLLAIALPAALAATPKGLSFQTLTHAGIERRYALYLPSTYDGLKPLPVVLMLHGGGGSAKGAIEETGWEKKAEAEGFIAVFPEALPPEPRAPASFGKNPQIWNDGSGRLHAGERNIDDVGFVRALIQLLIAQYKVDSRRIYVTGFSNGASMAFRLGVELSTLIAAIAPVAGAFWLTDPRPEHPRSLLYITGTDDPLNPMDGGAPRLLGSLNMLGGKPKPPVFDSIQKWLDLAHLSLDPGLEESKSGVRTQRSKPVKGGCELVFVMIQGAGHAWPGGKSLLNARFVGETTDKLDATATIWDFFKAHSL